MKHRLLSFLLACSIVLAGCSGPPDASEPAPPASPQDALVIRGEAIYFERIAPPANAQLQVSLIDASLADTAQASVATAMVDNAGPPPIPFQLAAAKGTVDPSRRYSLRASLRDAEGRLWFTSDESHPVTPGDPGPVTIRMKFVAIADAAPASGPAGNDQASVTAVANATATTRYRCGDRLLDVEMTDDSVILRYGENEKRLPRARSASGSRYAQDGDEFWSRSGRAMLTLAGEQSDCEASDEVTPWEEAKARGVVVRVVGNEPGWLAEIGAGATPAMHLMLDYGEREVSFAASTPMRDNAGFRAEGDGVVAELRLVPEPCEDPMSGESFPLRADLDVDGKTYTGCGRRLSP
jgi:putative lipoprotein